MKELKGITECLYQDGNVALTYCDDILVILDEAIDRQSVKSEEVAEAIEQLKYAREQDREFDDGTFVDSLDLAITALQAYQPWMSVEDEKPESGKHVLLCCEIRPSGKRYVCDGYYAKPKSIIGGDDGECSTEYDEETDEYYLLEGYYEVIKNWGDYSSIAIDDFVVAWKSLPEPPQGE